MSGDTTLNNTIVARNFAGGNWSWRETTSTAR